MITVKWRWWYPADCIQSDDLDTHEHNWPMDSGEDVAAAIVQSEIDGNGTDGATSFEVQIVEPERMAGIYDVAIEWEPTTHATMRRATETV